jgi:hypothetical protein
MAVDKGEEQTFALLNDSLDKTKQKNNCKSVSKGKESTGECVCVCVPMLEKVSEAVIEV